MTNFSAEIPFLSVIIPAFNRFHYLKELVESLHEKADYPFELIIHDDNSTDDTKDQLLTLKDKVSTIILNDGLQMGLAESINRLVAVAGSNYILMLNADLKIEQSIFKDTVNVLECPFAGILSYMTVFGSVPQGLVNNGTYFAFARGIGAGCALGFRKNVWNQIGGWQSETVSSGNADVAFQTRVVRNGYYPVSFIKEHVSSLVSNMSLSRANGQDSTIGRQQYDCSYPRIFNMLDYELKSRQRYERAANAMQITYRAPEGEVNTEFWHHFCNELVTPEYDIDWKVAERYGHVAWKEEIKKRQVKFIAKNGNRNVLC